MESSATCSYELSIIIRLESPFTMRLTQGNTKATNHPYDSLVIMSFNWVLQVKAFSVLTSIKLLVKAETSVTSDNKSTQYRKTTTKIYTVPVDRAVRVNRKAPSRSV